MLSGGAVRAAGAPGPTGATGAVALSPVDLMRGRGRWRGSLPLLGPAFVASIAYVDPGNFAANFSAGAGEGYLLLWVIVAANLMAMLIQWLSAKVGLATGRNLPELCRDHFPTWVTRSLWVQAEIVAMATDLAEIIGGAVALNLIFGLPLVLGGLVTGAVALVLLSFQRRGHRPFELVITGLLAVILVGFLVNLLRVHIDGGAFAGGLVPRLQGSHSVLLATSILGATVMPHAIYLHSSLTQDRVETRSAADRRYLLSRQRVDVTAAMGLAGLVNISMLVIAAALFFHSRAVDTDSLDGIHQGLQASLGGGAALVFALALLASGLASSGVGTLAGQVVMQGFIARSIPLALRRALTMSPALIVLGAGVDPTKALVASQVVLSFGIPFALVPLLLLTRRVEVMRELVNSRRTTVAGAVITAAIIGLNVFLVATTLD